MQRVIRMIPFVLVLALAAPAVGQSIVPGDPNSYPSEVIKNSPHNLNNYPGVQAVGGVPGGRICLPCHTPHNAYPDAGDIEQALWNHEETEVVFDMYASVYTPTNTPGAGPSGPSKMCLSCHDGVTAVDNYGNPYTGTMSGGTVVMTGPRAIGRDADLTDDHPIGVEYPTSRPGEYNDPSGFAPGINSGPGVRLVTIDSKDRVECTSCHEPHNNGLGRFLRVPIEESYLCLQCHKK